MSKKDLVSVIIPIYNREKIIKKCIDSVINQTYENIEILLVDDASTDNSYKVMEEYKNKYSNIRIFTYKENKGVGYARNVGIDKAKGKYISFIDSDDYVDNDYVETLINNIGDSDLICCGHRDEYVDGGIIKKYKLCNNSFAYMQYGVVWSRMYTLSSINKNKTRFSYLKNSQDTRFIFEYIIYTNNVVTIDYLGYNRVIHKKDRLSPQRKVNSDRFVNVLSNIDCVLSESIKEKKYENELYYFVIKELINSIWVISSNNNYKQLCEEYNAMLNFMLDAFNKNDIEIHFVKNYDSIPLFIATNIYILCYKCHMDKLYLKFMNIRYRK